MSCARKYKRLSDNSSSCNPSTQKCCSRIRHMSAARAEKNWACCSSSRDARGKILGMTLLNGRFSCREFVRPVLHAERQRPKQEFSGVCPASLTKGPRASVAAKLALQTKIRHRIGMRLIVWRQVRESGLSTMLFVSGRGL